MIFCVTENTARVKFVSDLIVSFKNLPQRITDFFFTFSNSLTHYLRSICFNLVCISSLCWFILICLKYKFNKFVFFPLFLKKRSIVSQEICLETIYTSNDIIVRHCFCHLGLELHCRQCCPCTVRYISLVITLHNHRDELIIHSISLIAQVFPNSDYAWCPCKVFFLKEKATCESSICSLISSAINIEHFIFNTLSFAKLKMLQLT